MTRKSPIRKGLQVNASIEAANSDAYRAVAASEDLGIHKLGTEILNLIVDCLRVTRQPWDQYKLGLPGFEQAAKIRRLRRASQMLQAGPEKDAIIAEIQELSAREVERLRSFLDTLRPSAKGPKAKAG